MIPLTVCGTHQPGLLIQAMAVVGFAIAASVLITGYGRHWHIAISLTGSALAGLLLPVAARIGVWPFDAGWRIDCGFTPDPNVPVYYALMASVPLALVASLVTRRIGNR